MKFPNFLNTNVSGHCRATHNPSIENKISKTTRTMKIYFLPMPLFSFLTILLLGTACNTPIKKDLPNEKELSTVSKNFGNRCVSRFMQDKSGKLWFGTTDSGLFMYDGKSFNQFTIKDGLDCNKIYCILEDKDGKIWVGTEVGLCLYDGKTFSKIQIPWSNHRCCSSRIHLDSRCPANHRWLPEQKVVFRKVLKRRL